MMVNAPYLNATKGHFRHELLVAFAIRERPLLNV
jgi:hypothetical protein